MKYINTFFLIACAFFTVTQSTTGSELTLVSSEVAATKQEFQRTYSDLKRNLHQLQMEQEQAIEKAKLQSKKDQEGIKAFETYDTLIASRYVDSAGKYQRSQEVSKKDHDNLNSLFENYLRTNPLVGRLSAGHARKYLKWGISRLKELAEYNRSPDEDNNPHLEILARLTKENEMRLQTVTQLAGRLGVKLEEASSLVEVNKARDRMPASVTK